MSAPACKLSVVCPAFNEEEVLPRFHAELCAVLGPLQREFEIEILYVDDGSRDGTLEVLRRLAAADARVRYLSFSRNFGHQAALTAGLEHARGDVVVSMDSDLQHPPALVPALLEKWREGNDLVLTLRQDDPRLSPFKRLSSRTFYRILRWLSDTEVRAAASDFRLTSRKALDALLRLHETHRFLRGMVNWLGFPTATVPFMPASRAGGVSKYTLRRMLTLALDGMLSFSKVPLRLALLLGALLFVLGLGQGAYTLATALFTSAASGTGVVLTALFLVGGCVLGALGVLGEYVGRIYEQV
ncbi:MAG TPA: glycosyltransferase family 2 protein, partial [Gemmataceae bacterium]|nr:glycosyltransferase family 2 protein [Gemmataceae bacterium]